MNNIYKKVTIGEYAVTALFFSVLFTSFLPTTAHASLFLNNLNAIGDVPDPSVEYVETGPAGFGCGTHTMYPSPLNVAEGTSTFFDIVVCGGGNQYRGLDESFMAVVGGNYIVPLNGGAEIEGRVAIGGNLVINNTYGMAHSGGGSFVIGAGVEAVSVGGSVSGSGSLVLGSNDPSPTSHSIVSGGSNSFNITTGRKTINSPTLPMNVGAFMTDAVAASTSLQGEAATGTSNFAFGTGTLTGTNAAVEVFEIDGSILDPGFVGQAVFSDIAPGATIILNVSGTAVNLRHSLLAGRVNDPNNSGDKDALVYNVIWNFYEATSIVLNADTQGVVLAPNASVDLAMGSLNGRLYIGGDFTHSGPGSEVHNYPFTGRLPLTESTVDIELAKTISQPTALRGQTVTYTLTATNSSTNDASGVLVSDTLPAELEYVSHSGDGVYVPTDGLWTIGNLAANTSAILTIDVKVK